MVNRCGNSGHNGWLYFLGSKITADGDCNHKIKRRLLNSLLKSRDNTLPAKVRLVKAMVFPVVMYGCESWTIKKTECQRIDAFEVLCWRRLLRVPWTARRSNQPTLKISPRCSLEGLMMKLKLQYSGHLMQSTDSFEKTLMLGKIEGGKRRGQQKMRWLDGITDSMGIVGDGQGGLACCSPWNRKELDTTEWLNWTDASVLIPQLRWLHCGYVGQLLCWNYTLKYSESMGYQTAIYWERVKG